MIFDKLGLPKEIGASDLQDSSRLAGIMCSVGYKLPIELYVTGPGKYVRHPLEYRYTFSRDQAICLLAGLYFSGLNYLVDSNYKTEGDLVSPAVRGHFKRCAGKSSNWLERAWLYLDVLYNAYIVPSSEPNQLICMLLVSNDLQCLKLWTRLNPKWKDEVLEYWTGWRGEPELAERIINTVNNRLETY